MTMVQMMMQERRSGMNMVSEQSFENALDKIRELSKTNAALLEALKRIRDYSRGILDDAIEDQEYLDEGWVWRVADDAIRKSKGE